MALLDRLHILWRLVVGRGCYDMPTKEDLLEYDRATCVQEIPIYDFELYRKCGGRAAWLEFAGCSVLRDRKTKAFGIKRTGGGPLWSGCVGFGLGRLLSVFLSYYGTEEREWPRYVRLGLTEMRRFNGYRG
jgi:hypothetical protein